MDDANLKQHMERPKAAIRRFGVFAEYNRQQAIKDGMPADKPRPTDSGLRKSSPRVAMGRAKPAESVGKRKQSQVCHGKWRRLNGKSQTAKLFDRESMSRMGRAFYSAVFVPAIRKSIANHERYTDMRDRIRKDWEPE